MKMIDRAGMAVDLDMVETGEIAPQRRQRLAEAHAHRTRLSGILPQNLVARFHPCRAIAR